MDGIESVDKDGLSAVLGEGVVTSAARLTLSGNLLGVLRGGAKARWPLGRGEGHVYRLLRF